MCRGCSVHNTYSGSRKSNSRPRRLPRGPGPVRPTTAAAVAAWESLSRFCSFSRRTFENAFLFAHGYNNNSAAYYSNRFVCTYRNYRAGPRRSTEAAFFFSSSSSSSRVSRRNRRIHDDGIIKYYRGHMATWTDYYYYYYLSVIRRARITEIYTSNIYILYILSSGSIKYKIFSANDQTRRAVLLFTNYVITTRGPGALAQLRFTPFGTGWKSRANVLFARAQQQQQQPQLLFGLLIGIRSRRRIRSSTHAYYFLLSLFV